MPRYFFHLENGELVSDDDGEQLMDDAAARRAGVRALAELLLARQEKLHDDASLVVQIDRDGVGRVFTLKASVQAHRREATPPR